MDQCVERRHRPHAADRGQDAQGRGSATQGGSGTTVTYPAVTLGDTSGASALIAFAGHASIDTSLETAPGTLTNFATVVDATDEAAGHIQTGRTTNFVSTNVSVSGTTGGWRTYVFEVAEVSAPDDFVDDFNGSDSNLETGLGWSRFSGVATDFQVKSNKLSVIHTADTVLHGPDLNSSDQFLEVTVENIDRPSNSFIALRVQDIDNYVGIRWDGDALEVIPRVNGSFDLSQLLVGTVAIGDVVRFEVQGQRVAWYINGVLEDTYQSSGIAALRLDQAGPDRPRAVGPMARRSHFRRAQPAGRVPCDRHHGCCGVGQRRICRHRRV